MTIQAEEQERNQQYVQQHDREIVPSSHRKRHTGHTTQVVAKNKIEEPSSTNERKYMRKKNKKINGYQDNIQSIMVVRSSLLVVQSSHITNISNIPSIQPPIPSTARLSEKEKATTEMKTELKKDLIKPPTHTAKSSNTQT